MKRIVLLILLTGGMLTASRLYSAFEDTGVTARAKAMGDALFADFDGVNSMNNNPATIAMTRSIQTYAAWDTPYAGLNDETGINTINFSVVVPFWNRFTIPPDPFFSKRAALGVSIHRLSVGGPDVDSTSVEFYHEGIYSLIYAKDLNDVISKGARMSAGVKMSLYDIGVGNSLDVQNNENFTRLGNISFGLDLGLTYDFSESIRLGIAYKNLLAPNVSIMPDGQDILPTELRIGGNWDIGDIFYVLKKSKLGVGMISYGRDANDNRQSDSSWNVGFEFKQLTAEDLIKGSPFKGEMLAVRLGAVYEAKKVGDELDLGFTKMKGIFNITGGLGFNYVFNQSHQVNVDYSVEFGLNMGAVRHVVGLTYRFLFPNSAFAYREEARKELEFEELIKQRAESQNTNSAPDQKTTNQADDKSQTRSRQAK